MAFFIYLILIVLSFFAGLRDSTNNRVKSMELKLSLGLANRRGVHKLWGFGDYIIVINWMR